MLEDLSKNIADIREAIGVEADGAETLQAPVESCTHTQTDEHTYTSESNEDPEPTKPGAKAATQDKLNYLVETFVSKDGDEGEGEFIFPGDLEAHISENYDFEDRTLRKYRQKFLDRLKEEYAVGKHPQNETILYYAETEEAVRAWIDERAE
jgi:hypothetical protein